MNTLIGPFPLESIFSWQPSSKDIASRLAPFGADKIIKDLSFFVCVELWTFPNPVLEACVFEVFRLIDLQMFRQSS